MGVPSLEEVRELNDGAVQIIETPHGTNTGFLMGRPTEYRTTSEGVRWVDEACSVIKAIYEGEDVRDVVQRSEFDTEKLAVLVEKTDGLDLTADDVLAAVGEPTASDGSSSDDPKPLRQ